MTNRQRGCQKNQSYAELEQSDEFFDRRPEVNVVVREDMTLVEHHPVDLANRTKAVEVSKEGGRCCRLGSYKDKFSINVVAPLAPDARRDGKGCRTTEHVLLQS